MVTDKPGGYLYIASPYTHPSAMIREYRYLKVSHACSRMFQQGLIPYSPIVHWHEMAKIFEMPKDHNFWIMADSIMLTSSRGLVVLQLDGWEKSAGVEREIKFARLIGKPVTFIQDESDIR